MQDINFNLHKAKSICDGKLTYCSNFSKIYTFTNENIAEYLQYFDLQDKTLLTVGSSADQMLNAFYYGTKDVTLYDINEYCKYYAYLKISAIISLNYKEFQTFFFKYDLQYNYNKDMFSKYLFNKIKPTLKSLDYESYLFFEELFSLYNPFTIRRRLFDDDEYRNQIITNFNIYLKNEENYNRLKIILKTITFKYINADIFKCDIDEKFDNIILSNLCTTTDIQTLRKLIEKLDINNLKDNGSILFAYLWNTTFDEDIYEENYKEIYKMPITRELLKEYITQYHNVRNSKDILWNTDTKKDLVLIYRKK